MAGVAFGCVSSLSNRDDDGNMTCVGRWWRRIRAIDLELKEKGGDTDKIEDDKMETLRLLSPLWAINQHANSRCVLVICRSVVHDTFALWRRKKVAGRRGRRMRPGTCPPCPSENVRIYAH